MLRCHARTPYLHERLARLAIECVAHLGFYDVARQVIHSPDVIPNAHRLDCALPIRGIDHRSSRVALVEHDQIPLLSEQPLGERVHTRRVVVHDHDQRLATLGSAIPRRLGVRGLACDAALVERRYDATPCGSVLVKLARPDLHDGERADHQRARRALRQADRDAGFAVFSQSPWPWRALRPRHD